ncbi:D-inositol-3-phosphate glycosyltransferase [Halomonadaceae bacterium LMG 33818]
MRVALVTDWLVSYAGSERVEEAILRLYPNADVFTCVYDPSRFEKTLFANVSVTESFISRLPGARKHYQKYLPLMPLAVEQFDLSGYDVVISSSHAVAKGVITGPDQCHICYCHTPMRYAWDFQHQYLEGAGLTQGIKGLLARYLLHRLRNWDVISANRVDHFIANSRYIARRIEKVYRRSAKVIYPNVDTDAFPLGQQKEEFYLVVSRLVPYKKVPLIVEAFSRMPDKKLVVIGSGDQQQVDQLTHQLPENVDYLGFQPDETVREYMQRAKAFVFAGEEDFGIVLVEAQAAGTPVIAYDHGGASETVLDGVTGILYNEQSAQALVAAVERFDANGVEASAQQIREHAGTFSEAVFATRMQQCITAWYKATMLECSSPSEETHHG